jgi:hypothetical protein
MAALQCQMLPTLWPEPAVWTDVRELMSLLLTRDGAPTWEVSRRAKAGSICDDLITNGNTGTFETAKAAALFERRARSLE